MVMIDHDDNINNNNMIYKRYRSARRRTVRVLLNKRALVFPKIFARALAPRRRRMGFVVTRNTGGDSDREKNNNNKRSLGKCLCAQRRQCSK